MSMSGNDLTRRLGMVGVLAFVALVLFAALVREPWPTDPLYLLVRWPFWAIAGIGAPLLALRIALWRRRRRQSGGERLAHRSPHEQSGQ